MLLGVEVPSGNDSATRHVKAPVLAIVYGMACDGYEHVEPPPHVTWTVEPGIASWYARAKLRHGELLVHGVLESEPDGDR